MKYVYITMLLFFFTGCSGQKKENANIPTPDTALQFTLTEPPAVLTDPAERAKFVIEHYWNNFDFTDIRYIDAPEITEQAFVDFIHIMPHTTYEAGRDAIVKMLKKAEVNSDMFHYFTELYEKYLYDPNSPFRDEEYYIPVLESIIASDIIEATDKIRPMHLLDLAYKNRPGEQALDFTYTLASGKEGTLHDISAEYTLLYFYNPDCHSCKEITASLVASPTIDQAIRRGKLNILAVYPDEDLTAWKEHLSEIPSRWINSYDDGTHIKNEDIYDLKAIPTLYLLGENKEVILKDTTFEILESFLKYN
ncbi:MAG: DUF5106 domain-containing protein [Tannerellaceae bacterium]|nr:DUF5106 domain-containing protein [Tannerellaceae bacterium]